MSFADDLCDFCGRDTEGSELAKRAGLRLWCGACLEGRNAQWGHLSNEELVKLRDKYQALYDEDPIDWSSWQSENALRVEPMSKEDNQRHLNRLAYKDTVAELSQVLRDRGIDPDTV